MKDKIKELLVVVVHTMNVPFFLVRVLIMIIPIILGGIIADYTNDDDWCHFVVSMLLAVYTSGLIGMIGRMVMWKVYKIDDRQIRDYLVERLKEERLKKTLNK